MQKNKHKTSILTSVWCFFLPFDIATLFLSFLALMKIFKWKLLFVSSSRYALFVSVWNDHDENNSYVGNLISGAVNLHMHTMPRNKPKVKWTTEQAKKNTNVTPIVNERKKKKCITNGEPRNNSSSMQTICLDVVHLMMSVLFNF